MAMPRVLASEEIEAALTNLPDWKRQGGAIVASYAFASFRDAVASSSASASRPRR
jgi:pterin-4a-carbinolamine dehydratase